MKTSKTPYSEVLMNYLSLGDLHLGHKNTTTTFMINNLETFFKVNYALVCKLDVIFIQGDVFDRLLDKNSSEYILASEWIYSLGLFCITNNIKLRILKGTSSHDWDQVNLIDRALRTLKKELDFMYVKTLHIEYIEKYGVNVLYVPDEYKLKAVDTFTDIKKLLVEKGIEKVDIAIMHGNFNYQLPIRADFSHDEKSFLSVVKHYITINHIHTASIFDRIIAPGSFDRICHGEEEDKGCVHVTLFKNGDHRFSFLKNPNAKIYKTIKCFKMGLNTIFNKIRKDIKGLLPDSYVRILVDTDTHLVKNIEDFSKTFPYLNFKIETEQEAKSKVNDKNIIVIDEPIDSFHITKENVEELLVEELKKHNLSEIELQLAMSELREAIAQV